MADFFISLIRMQNPDKSDERQGFTLIELSVVIIILGLLVGGILGGRHLIRAAELQNVGKEYQQWHLAVNQFIEVYNSVPGDMLDATDFWADTWDGDGDGAVDDATAAGIAGEIFTFWQQLALAGMINGEYTGIEGGGGPGPDDFMDSIVGENVPGSRVSSGGWSVNWVPADGVFTNDWYEIDYGNQFEIGGKIPDFEMGAPLFTPEEAWSIDRKFDDGEPAKGMIIARYWNDLCAEAIDGTSTADDLEAQYRVDDSAVRCALTFRRAF